MPRSTSLTVAVLAGVAAAGTVGYLGVDALLAAAVGTCLAVAVALLLRMRRRHPDHLTGEGWRDSRWAALSTTTVNASALLGLLLVPVSDEYRLALAMLVILAGFVGYVAGSTAELERSSPAGGPADASRDG